MFRTLRAVVAVLVLCLFAGSCQVLSWWMDVPAQVSVGSIFTILVGEKTAAGAEHVAAVLQLPNGFQVVGASALVVGGSTSSIVPNGGRRDDPNVLASYVAEPGHYLASFQGPGLSLGPAITVTSTLKVYIRAPTGPGVHQVKLALGNLGPTGLPPYVHQVPVGIVDFAAITTTSNVRSVQLLAEPPPRPFTPVTTEHWDTQFPASSVAMGDLDADGRDDFAESEPSGVRAYVTRGGAMVEVTGNLPASLHLFATEIVDFDGDGMGDLLVRPSGLGTPLVVYGSGGPQWTVGPSLSAGGFPTRGTIADVTADGRPDVLLQEGGNIHVYRANADRTFTHMATGMAPGQVLLTADLDADGAAEVLLSTSAGPVQLWRTDGTGSWFLAGDLQLGSPLLPGSNPFVAIDLDGDGRREIVRGGSSAGYRYVAGTLVPIWTQPIVFDRAVALDHDRSGSSDLVTFGPSGLQLWRNTGVGFFQNVVVPRAAGFIGVFGVDRLAMADIDGDSFPDLVAQMPDGPMLWRNTTTGSARYGSACAGPGFAAPQLSAQGVVAPGQSVTVQMTGALPDGPGFLWAGLSKRTWAGAPLLPLALAPIGAPDCELLAEPSVIVPKTADASGLITHVLPLPSLLPTDTLTFFLQGAVFAPGANAFPFLFSQGLALKMQ
jgi:hypothetical protein